LLEAIYPTPAEQEVVGIFKRAQNICKNCITYTGPNPLLTHRGPRAKLCEEPPKKYLYTPMFSVYSPELSRGNRGMCVAWIVLRHTGTTLYGRGSEAYAT
jgi:hypothetical protein